MKKKFEKEILYEIYCKLYPIKEEEKHKYAEIEDFTYNELELLIVKILPNFTNSPIRQIQKELNYLSRKYDKKTKEVISVSFVMTKDNWKWIEERWGKKYLKYKPKNYEIILYKKDGIPNDRKKDLKNFVTFRNKHITSVVWSNRIGEFWALIGLVLGGLFLLFIAFGRGCSDTWFYYEILGG